MGLIYPGVPNWIADFAASSNQIYAAIETGTHVGNSTRQLSSKFQLVETIESSAELFEKAQKLSVERKNIRFHLGESSQTLSRILQNHTEPIFFWLDAHYSGGNTSGLMAPCPLLQELGVLADWNLVQDSIICVDDARLFGAPHDLAPQMEGWPSTFEVLMQIDSMNLSSFIMDDVIVAIPEKLRKSYMNAYSNQFISGQPPKVKTKNLLKKLLR